ncbi:unnamed protein product [Protopolystoma xenopodis]|uniref:Uncharacterized protein n=1 Tax=Protopolystoma xenopodis TaxID=117903 RepID=A0A448X5C1_9PLAT|nr:unnamed protein product [Protopolystoma xenopodis]
MLLDSRRTANGEPPSAPLKYQPKPRGLDLLRAHLKLPRGRPIFGGLRLLGQSVEATSGLANKSKSHSAVSYADQMEYSL